MHCMPGKLGGREGADHLREGMLALRVPQRNQAAGPQARACHDRQLAPHVCLYRQWLQAPRLEHGLRKLQLHTQLCLGLHLERNCSLVAVVQEPCCTAAEHW